jgi:prophage endopeptidase
MPNTPENWLMPKLLIVCSAMSAGKRSAAAQRKLSRERRGQHRRPGRCYRPPTYSSAERDYFNLRERIVTVTKQVGYLQDYIRTQCLKIVNTSMP